MNDTTQDLFVARAIRDDGIARAIDHADAVQPSWSDTAATFLAEYAKRHARFSIEDVRLASAGVVADPPHKRAWGGVAVRGVRSGLLVAAGFTQSKREDGHCMNLRLWQSTVYAP